MRGEVTIVLLGLFLMGGTLSSVQYFNNKVEAERMAERAARHAVRRAAAVRKRGFEYRPKSSSQCQGRTGRAGVNPVNVHLMLASKVGYCAKFENADLSGRNLQEVALGSANLRNANLQGADLTGADLMGADLRGARLEGAKLLQARFDSHTRLPFTVDEALRRGMIRIGSEDSLVQLTRPRLLQHQSQS